LFTSGVPWLPQLPLLTVTFMIAISSGDLTFWLVAGETPLRLPWFVAKFTQLVMLLH